MPKMKLMKSKYLFFLIITCFFSCKEDAEVALLDEKEIREFSIENATTEINQEQKEILVKIPYNADITTLTPSIRLSVLSATVSPPSRKPMDFSQPVTYTVTAENGSVQAYVVTVITIPNNENEILDFKLNHRNMSFSGVLDHENGRVRFGLPFSKINRDSLFTTSIIISDSATINPPSGETFQYYNPDNFTVTAQNGSVKEYTLILQNNENRIVDFSIPNLFWFWGDKNKHSGLPEDNEGLGENYYYNLVLENEDVSNVIPEIVIPENASIHPPIGTPINLEDDVNYTVTAENGEVREYKIRSIVKSIIFANDYSRNSSGLFLYGFNNYWFVYDRTISEVEKAEFIEINTKEVLEMTTTTEYSEENNSYYLYAFSIDGKAIPQGSYQLKVYLENGEVILTRVYFSIEIY